MWANTENILIGLQKCRLIRYNSIFCEKACSNFTSVGCVSLSLFLSFCSKCVSNKISNESIERAISLFTNMELINGFIRSDPIDSPPSPKCCFQRELMQELIYSKKMTHSCTVHIHFSYNTYLLIGRSNNKNLFASSSTTTTISDKCTFLHRLSLQTRTPPVGLTSRSRGLVHAFCLSQTK